MWKLPASERLSRWREFRKVIGTMPIEQAIAETAEFWRSCPFTPFYLEADQPNTWPSPWQLIDENYYCDIAKCLGIVYTLLLSEHRDTIDFEIRAYYDPEARVTYNLAWLGGGKYVLNFIDDEIVNNTSIDKKLKLQHRWTSSDLNLEQY
jgi:hypothetical protein